MCTTAHPCQEVLASGLGSGFHAQVFVDAGFVYVSTIQGLMREPSTGRATASLVLSSQNGSFVINQTDLCWTDLHAIKCQPLLSKTVATIRAFPAARYIGALLRVGSTFYWIRDGEWIESMSTVGGAVTTIAHVRHSTNRGSDDIVNSLTSDGTYLYWASRVVVESRLLGGGPIVTVFKPAAPILFHDFKAVGGDLVFVDDQGMSVLPTAGARRALLNQFTWIDQIALDGSTVYWADSFTSTLNSIPIGGGAITHYPTVGSPTALAVDATSLCYVTRHGDLVKVTPK